MMKKAGSKRLAVKDAVAGKKASARKGEGDPPVLRLPLVGKVKRADIRKAVLAVRAKKAKARAAAAE